MALNDVFGTSKTKYCSHYPATGSIPHSVELLKDVRQVFLGNAYPVIGDAYLHVRGTDDVRTFFETTEEDTEIPAYEIPA